MKLRPNMAIWNPMEPVTFAVASDDYKLVFSKSNHTHRCFSLFFTPEEISEEKLSDNQKLTNNQDYSNK